MCFVIGHDGGDRTVLEVGYHAAIAPDPHLVGEDAKAFMALHFRAGGRKGPRSSRALLQHRQICVIGAIRRRYKHCRKHLNDFRGILSSGSNWVGLMFMSVETGGP